MLRRSLFLGAIATIAPACGDVASQRDVKCGAQPVEVLPNGSFDNPTPPWIQEPVTPALLCGTPRITPFNGAQAGCLGGTDGTTQTLSQTIPLPAGAKTIKLSGQICIATVDTLQFDVVDGATTVASLGKRTNQQGVANCVFTAFELSAPASSDPVMATLRIRSTLDANMPTSFYLDALSLTVGCTP